MIAVSVFIKGRMYDYNNGRFLSVDPFIQAPTSTQSLNPYTYIFNNPLSGTDPTGYLSSVNTGFQSFSGYCGPVGCVNAGAEDDNGLILFDLDRGDAGVSLSDMFSDNSKFSSIGDMFTRLFKSKLSDSTEGDRIQAPNVGEVTAAVLANYSSELGHTVADLSVGAIDGATPDFIIDPENFYSIHNQDAYDVGEVLGFTAITGGFASGGSLGFTVGRNVSKLISPQFALGFIPRRSVTRLATSRNAIKPNQKFIVSENGTVLSTEKDLNLVSSENRGGDWFQIHNKHLDFKVNGSPHTHFPKRHNLNTNREIRATDGSDLDYADQSLKNGSMRERVNRKDKGGVQ